MIYIIIGTIILVLVLIFLLFLLIPLSLSLSLKKQGSVINGKFTMKFLGIRLISKEIPGDETEGKEKKKKETVEDDKDRFNLDRAINILKLFLNAWPHIQKLLMSIYHSFTLEKFSMNLTMGLESPADTAMFTGYIWAFTNPLKALTPIHVLVIPEFNRRVLDGDLEVDLKLRLWGIVTEAIRAYTKKPVRELISEIRS